MRGLPDAYEYWSVPPPEPSRALARWVAKIEAGWKPNRRIRQMGRDGSIDYFEVYAWEWQEVLYPLLYPDSYARGKIVTDALNH